MTRSAQHERWAKEIGEAADRGRADRQRIERELHGFTELRSIIMWLPPETNLGPAIFWSVAALLLIWLIALSVAVGG